MDFDEGSVICGGKLLRRPCICSENKSLALQGICGYTAIEALSRARPADANPESLVFCTDRGTAFKSEQRSEPSAGVGVQESKDSPGVVAQFSVHVFRLGKSVWRLRHYKRSWGTRIRDSRYRFTHNRCRKRRSCWRVKSPAFCSVLLPNPKCSGQRQKS